MPRNIPGFSYLDIPLWAEARALELTRRLEEVQVEIERLADQDPRSENPEISARISALVKERRALVLAVEALATPDGPGVLGSSPVGVNSAGEIVNDDQAAREPLSRDVNPNLGQLTVGANGRIQTAADTTSGSNAINDKINVDVGVNGDLRPYTDTQAINASTGGIPIRAQEGLPVLAEDGALSSLRRNPESGQLYVPLSAGVGAPGDDRGPSGSNNVVASLNAIDWSDKITPRDNVLDQYSSYTYQASLYLMDKTSYEQSIDAGNKNLSNAKLLIQTGGAPQGSLRSDSFDLDYYIDRIELKSFFAGKSVGLSHNVKDVSMTVVEPNGISFIQNLNSAVQQYLGNVSQSGPTFYENNGQASTTGGRQLNFTSQIYLLVIRFYGYDDQGNLVRGGVNKPNQTSDPSAFVEKWYPLIITKINFRIASKAVEYEIQAKAPAYYVGASSGRGTIPFNMEFSGRTLNDLLGNSTTFTPTAAGNNTNRSSARALATQTVTPFVETAGGAAVGNRLNVGRRRLPAPATNPTDARLAAGTQTTPGGTPAASTRPPPNALAARTTQTTVREGLMAALNKYQQQLEASGVIDYADEYELEFALDSMASATLPNPGLNKSATPMNKPTTAAEQKLGTKQSMDPSARNFGSTAGQQIVQFIDNAIRNSSFIRDQQTVVVDEKTGNENTTGINIKNTTWYKIGFKATPMYDKYDTKRNDYAYKIKYIVSPFRIAQLNSPYFKVPTYPGPHKRYRYWFTGENSQVLNYEESLNSLYYIVMTNSNLGGATSSDNEALKYYPGTASSQTIQNAEGRTNMPSASAADQLYSPSDLKECNMTIVGDPAWLQQGEAITALSKGDTYYFQPWLADGTINFDAQQILFEIGFNVPRDYNLPSGLIEPAQGTINSTTQLDQLTQTPGSSQISRIYIAKECISSFVKGKFTQQLKGSLMVYYPAKKAQEREAITQAAAGRTAANTGARTQSKAPAWTRPTSVTGTQPTSALAKGVQQILNPPTQLDNPTLTQLQSSPVYILARRGGATPQAALAAAQAAFAAGTNNFSGTALPGIRVPGQQIVKDQ